MMLLFGILAIILGLLLPFLFGWIGFTIPTVCGTLAIVFNILKNRKMKAEGSRRRVAGFVCGGIGILIAALLMAGLNAATDKLKKEMAKYGADKNFPILEKSIDRLASGGVVGMIIYAKNEVSANIDALKAEFDSLKSYMDGSTPADNSGSSEAASEASTGAAEGGEAATEAAAEGGDAGAAEGQAGGEAEQTGNEMGGGEETQ